MSKTKLYISGAITNNQHYKREFDSAEISLLQYGYEVVNPLNVAKCNGWKCNTVPTHSWECCLKYDIAALVFCNGLALIPGFLGSRGAMLEIDIAHRLNMEIKTIEEWVDAKFSLSYT